MSIQVRRRTRFIQGSKERVDTIASRTPNLVLSWILKCSIFPRLEQSTFSDGGCSLFAKAIEAPSLGRGAFTDSDDLELLQNEENIEICSSVRKTKGIIELDPAIARDIADSDE
jgi:hypothetical protein